VIDALTTIHNTTKDVAIEIYKICGGDIREGVRAIRDGGRRCYYYLARTISLLSAGELPVASFSTTTSGLSKDRLRTMFLRPEEESDKIFPRLEEESDNMDDASNVMQIVDSVYAIQLLVGKLSTNDYLQGYRLAMAIEANSVVGAYFEGFWNRWFETTKPGGITVVRSIGKDEECIFQLTQKDQYWIPVKNFANIDAAIIRNDTLYVLQYTVQRDHKLNEITLQSNVATVLKNKAFEGVRSVRSDLVCGA
jgi:hypothetical protein